MKDFIIFQSDKFSLRYRDCHNPTGFTHLLSVYDAQTEKEITGMWIDPTDDRYRSYQHVGKLMSLKGTAYYDQAVADFIEYLINNAGYSSLKIASLMKEALKHHSNLPQLMKTIEEVDLRNVSLRDEDQVSSSFDISELKALMAGFVETLKEFVTNLLGSEAKEAPSRDTYRFHQPATQPVKVLDPARENDQVTP